MNSSKIKNLLIILLAAVNLFLLVNILSAKSADSYLSDEMLDASVSALAAKEIYIDKHQIPAQRYSQNVILMNSSHNVRLNSANSFLGDVVAEYSLPDGATFQSSDAYVSFFDDGHVEYGLLGNRDAPTPTTLTLPDTLAAAERGVLKNVKAVFDKIKTNSNFDKLTYRVLGQLSQDGTKTVFVDLMYDNLRLNDGVVVMVFDNGILTYLSGKYLFDAVEAAYSQDYIDAPNALFLLDEKDIIIDEIQMIYYPVKSDEDKYFLIPSWKIDYDDTKAKIFDGVSGYKRK